MCSLQCRGKAQAGGDLTIQLAKYAHRPSRKAMQHSFMWGFSFIAPILETFNTVLCLLGWTRLPHPLLHWEGWVCNDAMIHFIVFHFISFLQLSSCASWPDALLVNMPQIPVSVSRFHIMALWWGFGLEDCSHPLRDATFSPVHSWTRKILFFWVIKILQAGNVDNPLV